MLQFSFLPLALCSSDELEAHREYFQKSARKNVRIADSCPPLERGRAAERLLTRRAFLGWRTQCEINTAAPTIIILIITISAACTPRLDAIQHATMSCNTANEDRDNRDPAPAPSASSGLSAVDGDATSLYEYINRDKVWGANLDPPESAKHVIKPWDQRLTAEPSTQSNVDDQIAITVPFTCPVRLKSILINTGTGDFAPTRCRAFVNRPDGVDFDDVEDATSQDHPAQLSPLAAAATLGSVASGKAQADFALLRGQDGVVEYPVSVARFSHTTSITIVLSHSNATTLSRFFYLGFRGTALVLKAEPGERLNIGAANAADRPVDGVREKRGASQGLAGGSGRSPRYVVASPRAAGRIARMAEGPASPNRSSEGTPRRSPRKNRHAQHADSPSTTPTRKRTRQSSGAADADDDSTTSTPRAPRSAAKTRTPANPPAPLRAPHTAPSARERPSLAAPSASAATSSNADAEVRRTASTASTSEGAPHRRRSLSQPPPNDVLLRQLQSSAMTPSAKYALTNTPARRILGTPRRAIPGSASASASNPFAADVQTPATDKRRKRGNDALLASAQRTRERRQSARKSLLWGGVGGWAGGREESPMDLLRRLARAPGFVAPPTPSLDSIAMPPPGARLGRASSASEVDASTSSLGSRARDRARDSMASSSTPSNRSSLASRATMLVPGESVPGDLTRDSNVSDSLDVDESMASIGSPDERSRSRLSDIGIPRRTSGMGMVRGGIFAAMAERPKQSRVSTGSRVSFADQLSPASMRFDDMSSRREDELERSLQQSRGAESFVSASGIDLATQRAIARLDDLTRRSFFSDDGGLHLDEDDDDASADADARRRTSVGRSMSEPLEGEADGSIVVFDNVDDGYGMHVEEDEVSDSLAIEGDDDSDGEVRRLEDGSLSREAMGREDASGSGDDSRVSRVSFADQDEVSFQVDDAYSDDDDVQYGLSSMQEELDDDDEEDGDERDASARRLDLLDAKDLNALLKRRIVKKRRARKSPHTGNAVPPLPASIMRDMFASFLTPAASSSASLLSSSGSAPAKKAKLDATVLDELDAAAHDFFADFAANLLQQAKARTSRRAGEGMSINEADVVGVLKRQGRVTQRHDASSLAHRLMPRELTDQMELSRWAKTGTVQTTLGFSAKKKKARADKSMADTTAASSAVLEDETM